jgi:hypothetical protein
MIEAFMHTRMFLFATKQSADRGWFKPGRLSKMSPLLPAVLLERH